MKKLEQFAVRIRRGLTRRFAAALYGRLSRRALFNFYYATGIWKNSANAEALSGEGSTMAATVGIRAWLADEIAAGRIRSILDAPCGEFSWMKSAIAGGQVRYVGGDVSDLIISRNVRKHPEYSFITLDLCVDQLPIADLMLCRDCLFHLSHLDIVRALRNIERFNFTQIAITNHQGVVANVDIPTGSFRPLDLTLPPFNLPPPDRKVAETSTDRHPHYLGIWSKENFDLSRIQAIPW